MNIDELLKIDLSSPTQQLAIEQEEEDRRLLDRLVQRRRDLGLSQSDVGARLGLSQSAIAKIETGDRDPRLSTLRRYALALGALIRHDVRGWQRAGEGTRETMITWAAPSSTCDLRWPTGPTTVVALRTSTLHSSSDH